MPGSQILLERNPTWWGEPPAFERIVVKAIENTTALEANLLSGEVDMIEGSLGLSLDQALAFERRTATGSRCSTSRAWSTSTWTSCSTTRRWPTSRCARRCSTASTARRSTERLFAGRQPVADTIVIRSTGSIPTRSAATPSIRPRPRPCSTRPAGARRDGVRRNAAGEPCGIELMTTAGNRTRELIQQVAQGQWRQLGIET